MPEVCLAEWETRGPEDECLRDRQFEPAERRLAQELARTGALRIEELRQGLRISAFAHVGRIQLGDLTVTVRPKIPGADLVDLFAHAFGLRNLRLFDEAGFGPAGTLFQDLLALQLLKEARQLIAAGLMRQYIEVHSDLASPRGRIDFCALARRPNWNRVSLPCREHSRSPANLLNRVLRAGLVLAAEVAQDRDLVRQLRGCDEVLESVGWVELNDVVLEQAQRSMTRLTSAYAPALQLIALLYSSCRISLDDGPLARLPGFLFDMNRFFQALVGRFLVEHAVALDVQEEKSLTGYMRYLPEHNPRGRRAPLPRPDFTVLEGKKFLTFLDAKYRDLWNKDLPREMLYQLAIYALSHSDSRRAAIIYPCHTGQAQEAIIEIQNPAGGGAPARVAVRPFDLGAVCRVIRSGDREGGVRLARGLIHGGAAGARVSGPPAIESL